jgi:hypothetical protein
MTFENVVRSPQNTTVTPSNPNLRAVHSAAYKSVLMLSVRQILDNEEKHLLNEKLECEFFPFSHRTCNQLNAMGSMHKAAWRIKEGHQTRLLI